MSALSALLLGLTCIGTLYYVLSSLALIVHYRSPAPDTIILSPSKGPTPRISVLKPVCGIDESARANFESHLRQDYPDYEVIFGVLEPNDPAAEVIRGIDGAALVVGSEIDGSNNKVRILHSLANRATGEILVITDADTRVTPDFLSRPTAPFADESVGAVTCLYRGIEPKSFADSLEALHMSCVFAPGVACAERLRGIDFGLGAAIAIRRGVLDKIGGFEGIVDYLADDFQLGRRAALAGYRVVLSDYVMEIVLGGESLAGVLARELRWSRTTKISRPAGHFGLIATFGFAYSLLFMISTGFAALGWEAVAGVAAIRSLTATFAARAMRDDQLPRRAYLLPLRDILSFGIWVAGYFSRTIYWRKRRLRLFRDGRMVAS